MRNALAMGRMLAGKAAGLSTTVVTILGPTPSLATVHEMDVLLSCNCRHIANAAIQARLRRLAEKAGFALPVLCTPDELTGELYE